MMRLDQFTVKESTYFYFDPEKNQTAFSRLSDFRVECEFICAVAPEAKLPFHCRESFVKLILFYVDEYSLCYWNSFPLSLMH